MKSRVFGSDAFRAAVTERLTHLGLSVPRVNAALQAEANLLNDLREGLGKSPFAKRARSLVAWYAVATITPEKAGEPPERLPTDQRRRAVERACDQQHPHRRAFELLVLCDAAAQVCASTEE